MSVPKEIPILLGNDQSKPPIGYARLTQVAEALVDIKGGTALSGVYHGDKLVAVSFGPAVGDISGLLRSRRMLRLERVLRSLIVFFGMDENEMNAGIFREARGLLGDNVSKFDPDRKWCDCPFGTCTGLDVERCVFRYVEDCEKDSHETISEHEGTIRELLEAINDPAKDPFRALQAHLQNPHVRGAIDSNELGRLEALLRRQVAQLETTAEDLNQGFRSEQERYDDVSVTGSGRVVEDDLDPKWETLRDTEREAELLARKCGLCESDLQLAESFPDTGRPSRLRCTNPECTTLFRVVYESESWPLQIVAGQGKAT